MNENEHKGAKHLLVNGLARLGGCDDPETARVDGELTHSVIAAVLILIPAALAAIAVPLAINAGRATTSVPKTVAVTAVWVVVVLLIDIVVSRFGRLFPAWGRMLVLPARAIPALASALFITKLAVAGLLIMDTDRLWNNETPNRVAKAQTALSESQEAKDLSLKQRELTAALEELSTAKSSYTEANTTFAAECSGRYIPGKTSGRSGPGVACLAYETAKTTAMGDRSKAEAHVVTLRGPNGRGGEVAAAQAAYDKAVKDAGDVAKAQTPTLLQRLDLTDRVIEENPGGASWHWALVTILLFADMVPAFWALLPRTLTEMRQIEERRRRTRLEQQLTDAVVANGPAAVADPATVLAEAYVSEQSAQALVDVRAARARRSPGPRHVRGLAPLGAIAGLLLLATGIGLMGPWHRGGSSTATPTAVREEEVVEALTPASTPAAVQVVSGMLRANAPAYCRPLATRDVNRLAKALPALALSGVQDSAITARNQQLVKRGLAGMTAAQGQLPPSLRPQVVSTVSAAANYANNPTSGTAIDQLSKSLSALDLAFVKECAA